MPREPAYAAERRQDAESEGGIERAKNRMFVASVRLSGHGQPRTLPTGGRTYALFGRASRSGTTGSTPSTFRSLIT
jgi:hypothetical protein